MVCGYLIQFYCQPIDLSQYRKLVVHRVVMCSLLGALVTVFNRIGVGVVKVLISLGIEAVSVLSGFGVGVSVDVSFGVGGEDSEEVGDVVVDRVDEDVDVGVGDGVGDLVGVIVGAAVAIEVGVAAGVSVNDGSVVTTDAGDANVDVMLGRSSSSERMNSSVPSRSARRCRGGRRRGRAAAWSAWWDSRPGRGDRLRPTRAAVRP